MKAECAKSGPSAASASRPADSSRASKTAASCGSLPDRAHPVTHGFACNKGLAGVDVHRDPDRLDHPLQRSNGGFERVSWDDAIAQIATRVRGDRRRARPERDRVLHGQPDRVQHAGGAERRRVLRAARRAARASPPARRTAPTSSPAREAVFGSSTIHPIPDLDHTEFLLVLGANPRVSHGSFISVADPMERMREAKARGAKLYFVNPRRIESVARSTGAWIAIRPDTDVYLLAALLCEIDAAGGFDERALARHGKQRRRAARLRARGIPPSASPASPASPPTRSGDSRASGRAPAPRRCTCRPA